MYLARHVLLHRSRILHLHPLRLRTPARSVLRLAPSIYRYNSTSTIPIKKLIYNLADAVSATSLPDIHTHYHAISQAALSHGSDILTVNGYNYHGRLKQELARCFDILCKSAQPADARLMRTILADMEHTLAIPPDEQLHTRIIRALARRQDVHLLIDWLKSVSMAKGAFVPSREDWHSVLQMCASQREPLSTAYSALTLMRRYGVQYTQETFLLAVVAFHASSAHADDFGRLLEIMKRAGLPFNTDVHSALVSGFAHIGLRGQSAAVDAMYKSRFGRQESSLRSNVKEWANQLSEVARKQGIAEAIGLFGRLKQDGCTNSWPIVNAIIQHCKNADEVRHLEQSLDFKAGVQQWSLVITSRVRANDVNTALALFNLAVKGGITPDAPMVGPIIRSLCRSTVSPPSATSINQALHLYSVLKSKGDPSAGPDIDIYQSLLRAIATSPDVIPYLHTALGLIQDMEERNIAMTDSQASASVIVLLMRNAADASQAFEVYQRLRSSLDARGFGVVLHAFTKLPFTQTSHLYHLPYYFEMIRDMKRAGIARNEEVYSVFLRLLAQIATSLQQFPDSRHEAQDMVYHALQHTHHLISLDATFTPDTALWNQLMDAYQRAAYYGAAYCLWDEMYVSGNYNHASVSIILDTCGFARSYTTAAAISDRLFRSGFVFNQNNWDSWLECLCRCGHLDDALKTLCIDMASRANSKSVNILLSFARRDNRFAEVATLIEEHLPHVWQTLAPNERER